MRAVMRLHRKFAASDVRIGRGFCVCTIAGSSSEHLQFEGHAMAKRLMLFSGLCLCVNALSALPTAKAQRDTFVGTSAAASAVADTLSGFSMQPDTEIDPDEMLPVLSPQLVLDGTMRFYSSGSADVVQLDVTNAGLLPATEPEVTVEIGDQPFDGKLYQYWGGTATDPDTVNGGERGYVRIEVWPGALQECESYPITLRLPVQSDALKASIATQCPLRWTKPIDAKRLGATPDPLVAGKTLEDIVSSRVQGSPKGFCSNCHNRDAGLPPYYKPNVPPGSTSLIEPFDQIGNHIGSPTGQASWSFGGTSSNGGTYYSWAEWFISRNDKPEGLKQVFRKWIADGWQH
jgi:hypothetical protein